MVDVNDELGPFLRMSCPKEWEQRPLTEWQTGASLFRSVIFAFWVLPIDLHTFYMERVSAQGQAAQAAQATSKERSASITSSARSPNWRRS